MPDYRKYLDPEVLAKISRLELRARMVVEGFISGMHRSPYHGYSVEFASHREYVPGDDLRHIDWRLYARGDRLYIKQYEEETNLRTHILLDCSRSMAYPEHPTPPSPPLLRGGESQVPPLARGAESQFPPFTRGRKGGSGMSKFDYACTAAASLAHLLIHQQDACGLVLFDHAVRDQMLPATSTAQLQSMIELIERNRPDQTTDVKMLFSQLVERVRQRGLIILISDLLTPLGDVIRGLQQLRHLRHDVIVLHVLDHDELTFPFTSNTLFEGLEAPEAQVLADPQSLRTSYLELVDGFLGRLRSACVNHRIDYRLLSTRDPLDGALTAFLAARMRLRVQGSEPRVQGSEPRVQGSEPRVQGSEPRVQGSGFGVQ